MRQPNPDGCSVHGRQDCDDCFMAVCCPEPTQNDDVILHGNRWRKALQEIAAADPVDLALDPTWSQRIAKEALR